MREHEIEPTFPKLDPAFELKLLSKQALLKYCKDPELDLSQEFIAEAIARGDICAAAICHDEIAAYVWRAFTSTPHEDGLWVDFKHGYRYGYKAFTKAKYRKRHLQHAVGLYTDKLMLEKGISRGIGFVATHNYPSLISDARRGNQCVGYAGYLKVFGKIFPFRTPGAKKHDFRFYLKNEG